MENQNTPFSPGDRVVFYARDSGGVKQGQSVPQQEQAASDWCHEHGVILSRVFKDIARTGTTTTGRDEFLAMCDYLASKIPIPEKGIIFWEYARLARFYDDSMFYLADWRRRGYVVYSLTDAVPTGPEGKLLEAIISWKNDAFSRDLRKNVKRGMRDVVSKHHANFGDPPTGYYNNQVEVGKQRDGSPHMISQLKIDETTGPLVQKAFAMRAAGATGKEIHSELHLFNLNSQYFKMFRNPVYIGRRVYGGQVIDGYCQPLIDPETWQVVQDINKEHAQRHGIYHPRALRSRYALSGLLRCGGCGYLMTGAVVSHKPYPDRSYYRCQLHKNAFGKCRASMIPQTILEARVLQLTLENILVPEIVMEDYEKVKALALAGDTDYKAGIQRDRDNLAANERAIRRVVAAIKDMGHSPALLAELAALEKGQSELRESLAKKEAKAPRPLLDNPDISYLVNRLRDKLETGKPEEISAVLRSFIVAIIAKKPKGKELTGIIVYNLPIPTETWLTVYPTETLDRRPPIVMPL